MPARVSQQQLLSGNVHARALVLSYLPTSSSNPDRALSDTRATAVAGRRLDQPALLPAAAGAVSRAITGADSDQGAKAALGARSCRRPAAPAIARLVPRPRGDLRIHLDRIRDEAQHRMADSASHEVAERPIASPEVLVPPHQALRKVVDAVDAWILPRGRSTEPSRPPLSSGAGPTCLASRCVFHPQPDPQQSPIPLAHRLSAPPRAGRGRTDVPASPPFPGEHHVR